MISSLIFHLRFDIPLLLWNDLILEGADECLCMSKTVEVLSMAVISHHKHMLKFETENAKFEGPFLLPRK